jgi:putative endonuclease
MDDGSTRAPGKDASTRQRGDWAEQLAAAHLRTRGYRILATNFLCKGGELDLVARHGDTLCFIEVRFRRDPSRGRPIETIGQTKRRRLLRAARVFLQSHPEIDSFRQIMRFDAVTVTGDEAAEVKVHQNVFEADEVW